MLEVLEKVIELFGVDISVYSGKQLIIIFGIMLVKYYNEIIVLVLEMLLVLCWDEKEFELVKQEVLSMIVQQCVNFSSIVDNQYYKLLFGEDYILLNNLLGIVELVNVIIFDDLKQYYVVYLFFIVVSFYVVGVIDVDIVIVLLQLLNVVWLVIVVMLLVFESLFYFEFVFYFYDVFGVK